MYLLPADHSDVKDESSNRSIDCMECGEKALCYSAGIVGGSMAVLL